MNRMPVALAVSAGLHGAALAALILIATASPPLDQAPPKGFEIAMSPPDAAIEAARPVEPPPQPLEPPPPPVATVPPPPETPVAAPEVPLAPEPEVPVVTAQEPPPPPKPVPKPKPPPKPKPVVRRFEPPPPQLADLPPPLPSAVPTQGLPSPTAAPAPPVPRPDLAAGYRSMLSTWFESHKRYPNSARENAEQGSAIVHFRVDSAGRILDFGLSRSTGYADLDQSISDMLRSAQLPAFPPGMTVSYLDVAVTLHFSLTR